MGEKKIIENRLDHGICSVYLSTKKVTVKCEIHPLTFIGIRVKWKGCKNGLSLLCVGIKSPSPLSFTVCIPLFYYTHTHVTLCHIRILYTYQYIKNEEWHSIKLHKRNNDTVYVYIVNLYLYYVLIWFSSDTMVHEINQENLIFSFLLLKINITNSVEMEVAEYWIKSI